MTRCNLKANWSLKREIFLVYPYMQVFN